MKRERDKRAAALWVRLAKCYGVMLRELRRAQSEPELTLPQFDALAQLSRHPCGLTVSELSDALLVTAGNITGIADRLVARGLVSRTVSKHDRRVRILRLTPAGRRLADEAVARHERALGELLRGLCRDEQRSLTTGLDALRQALRESTEA